MVREINMGVECTSTGNFIYIISLSEYTTYIIEALPSLYNGTLTTFCTRIPDSGAGGSITFGTYRKDINGYFTKISNSSTGTIAPNVSGIATLDGESVPVTAGDYLGICLHNTDSNDPIGITETDLSGKFYRTKTITPCVNTDTPLSYSQSGTGYVKILHAEGIEPTPGNAPDACQDTGQFFGTYNGYGQITLTDVDCATLPYQCRTDIITPWGEADNSVFFYVGQTKQWNKSGANPTEHYSLKCLFVSCLAGGRVRFTECWWRDSDTYYVKNGGSDSNYGTQWDKAFATITKAASVVPDGGRVYIGFGTYNGETAISPVNKGVLGIAYKPVTAGASSGVGQVIIPF